MIKKLLFTVTQPSDNESFEHVVQIELHQGKMEVYGHENIKSVTDTVVIRDVINTALQSDKPGEIGPYKWEWL